MHPKQIESCIFRISLVEDSPFLRVSRLSVLQNSGIDPSEDQRSEYGYKFAGIKDFSESQKINLYDEFKNGFCRIELINKNTQEKRIYKSNGVFHTPQTNLISINFIKDEAQ
jgi:hypothetical protein